VQAYRLREEHPDLTLDPLGVFSDNIVDWEASQMEKRAANSNPLSGNISTRRHNNTVVFDIGRDGIEGLFYLVFDFGCFRCAQI
jgi:hypothetical protein